MKKILLHSLTLTNWRGEKQRTTEFHTDRPTCICGDNGLGKSRHFDAFCWLLFGKDSQDRKDFELRTYDEHHQPMHRCECSVSAVISVDGLEHTIKREYKEQWVKPRGQIEEVFKGNITECTWDGVPVKVSDFQKRIEDGIIDETVFKMITNPSYFATKMKWQLQRETLMQMAGTKTDEELADGNADFKALIDHLNGKSLIDFRKELAAEKKRLKAEADDIDPRIDQTQKMMPEAENWAELEADEKNLSVKVDVIDRQLEDEGERGKAAHKQIAQLNLQITKLKAHQSEVLQEQIAKARQEADSKNEQRHAIERQCKECATEKANTSIDISRTKERIGYLTKQIDSIGKELDDLRKEWYEIGASKYDGSDICPHCHQRLPEDMIAQAKDGFEEHKRKVLAMNNERGKALVAQRNTYQDELTAKQQQLTTLQSKAVSADARMQQLYEELAKHPMVKPTQCQPETLPEWAEAQRQIDSLNQQMADLVEPQSEDEVTAQLRQQRTEIQQQIKDIAQRLAKRAQIEQGDKMIEQLQKRGRELAQLIADLEKREYTAAQFSKKRIEDCEHRINSMFSIVRFQLFDQTQDGNEYECCIPLIGGVPYTVANTATQLNAGLDIINTLCRFNNVSAPIFCDNAESVNHYTPTQSQMIYLTVTDDRQLVIK